MLQMLKSDEVSERISILRETLLRIKPSVCTERARFYTQAYAENEDQPVIIKRACGRGKFAIIRHRYTWTNCSIQISLQTSHREDNGWCAPQPETLTGCNKQ